MGLTLSDLVARAADFADDERTPFAEEPWAPASEVIWNDGDDITPIVREGKVFSYFLEPSVILEISEFATVESPAARLARVIQYAENDA